MEWMDGYRPYGKDVLHRCVVNGEKEAVDEREKGTKVVALHVLKVLAGQSMVIQVALHQHDHKPAKWNAFAEFDAVFEQRKKEADEFYGNWASFY